MNLKVKGQLVFVKIHTVEDLIKEMYINQRRLAAQYLQDIIGGEIPRDEKATEAYNKGWNDCLNEINIPCEI